MNKKRLAFGMIMILILLTAACSSASPYDEQIQLGYKLIDEGKYEEAILAFNAAIEIDAKLPRAYVGLADTHYAIDDIDMVVDIHEILRQGFEASQSETIVDAYIRIARQLTVDGKTAEALDLLRKGYNVTQSERIRDEIEMVAANGMTDTLRREEWTIEGILLGTGTIYDFASTLGSEIIEGSNVNDEDSVEVLGHVIADTFNEGADTWINQPYGSDHVGYLQVFRNGVVGPRGIIVGVTTKEEALKLLCEDSDQEYVSYRFDESEGEARFRIHFEDDLVSWFFYNEDNFWSYGEPIGY